MNCCSYCFQRGYRVKLDEQKFIVPTDRVDLVCAKNAAEVLNEVRRIFCCSEAVCFALTPLYISVVLKQS